MLLLLKVGRFVAARVLACAVASALLLGRPPCEEESAHKAWLATVVAQTVNFDVDEIRPRRLGVRQGRYGEYEHGSNEGKRSEDFRHIRLPSDFCRDNITRLLSSDTRLLSSDLKNVSAASLTTIAVSERSLWNILC
jgi:hypothetical protein